MSTEQDSPRLLQGVGLFETMLVKESRVVLEDPHFDRMVASAREMEFPEPPRAQWDRAAGVALDVGPSPGELALRCVWMAHSREEWVMRADAFEIPEITRRRRRRGRVVLLPPEFRRAMPGHKSLSYLASFAGLERAEEEDADEGLFTTPRGGILEGTSTNVFALDRQTLITPPVSAGILPGIMRAWVLERAAALGLRVTQRLLQPADLLRGSFLTSSLTPLAPIRSVGGVDCLPPGEPYRTLAEVAETI